jgi:hypothetical protein
LRAGQTIPIAPIALLRETLPGLNTLAGVNACGRLRHCTEQTARAVDLDLFLAASVVVTQQFLRAAVRDVFRTTRSTAPRMR